MMTSDLASLKLATIAYRIATEMDFLPKLTQQLEEGAYTEEEAAALAIFLDQNTFDQADAPGTLNSPGPQLGWIG